MNFDVLERQPVKLPERNPDRPFLRAFTQQGAEAMSRILMGSPTVIGRTRTSEEAEKSSQLIWENLYPLDFAFHELDIQPIKSSAAYQFKKNALGEFQNQHFWFRNYSLLKWLSSWVRVILVTCLAGAVLTYLSLAGNYLLHFAENERFPGLAFWSIWASFVVFLLDQYFETQTIKVHRIDWVSWRIKSDYALPPEVETDRLRIAKRLDSAEFLVHKLSNSHLLEVKTGMQSYFIHKW